jgi:homogentisate 1,2-dioxygenase
MPYYVRRGEVPHKRHTQFRRPDGQLYTEEVMGMEGFSGIQSLLYHHYPPTRVRRMELLPSEKVEWLDYGPLRGRQFKTKNFPAGGDPQSGRRTIMGNADVTLSLSRPTESSKVFYRNGQAYETWFVHEGSGKLLSQFGSLSFRPGDYIVIPYGVTWRMELDSSDNRFLVIECPSEIQPPKRYRN